MINPWCIYVVNHTGTLVLVTASKIVQQWVETDRRSGSDGLRVGGKRVVGWSRPRGAPRRKRRTGEKKGGNNKAPVGAYILGKNCRGRKRMRGNRRGEGQDDGNLPADILCVSCERASVLGTFIPFFVSLLLFLSLLLAAIPLRYPPLSLLLAYLAILRWVH